MSILLKIHGESKLLGFMLPKYKIIAKINSAKNKVDKKYKNQEHWDNFVI